MKYRLQTRGVNVGGLVVAAVGLGLTRVVVVDAVDPSSTLATFLLTGMLPLALGLGLVVLGVGLAVSTIDPSSVDVVATWTVLGTVGMLLVVGTTLVEPLLSGTPIRRGVTGDFAVNALVGGAVAGVLVGMRSAAVRRHRRELARQADRTTVLNRILRHEVLNAVTAVRGYAELLATDGPAREDEEAAVATILDAAADIEAAIQEVGVLTGAAGDADASVAVAPLLGDAVADVRRRYPHADVEFRPPPEGVRVTAAPDLRMAFRELVDNAVEHGLGERATPGGAAREPGRAVASRRSPRRDGGEPAVTVAARTTEAAVSVRVADPGPGLPASQEAILCGRDLPEFDDPATGFGVPLARLLVEQYGGHVDVTGNPDAEAGTVVTVTFPRAGEAAQAGREPVGVRPSRLRNAVVASLVAGVLMGAVLQALTATLPIVGALYGVTSLGVGWVTHLFHSLTFGILFATGLARLDVSSAEPGRTTLVGVGYGVVLWLVAAGIVMPVWLRLVGVPAPVPDLDPVGLVGHLLWGAVLGGLYAVLPD